MILTDIDIIPYGTHAHAHHMHMLCMCMYTCHMCMHMLYMHNDTFLLVVRRMICAHTVLYVACACGCARCVHRDTSAAPRDAGSGRD